MKRTLLIALLAVVVMASGAAAQNIEDSLHDLSAGSGSGGSTTDAEGICVFCHTPHQSTIQNDPLWNHTLSLNGAYGVYSSATLNASPQEIDGTGSYSLLCMSCHDGTIAVNSLYNDPNDLAAAGDPVLTSAGNVTAGLITGDPNVGTSLTDDHPINFSYDAALVAADLADGGGLNDPTSGPVAALLIGGASGSVECASCHNAHDNQYGAFLVMSNENSLLCTTCHIK